MQWGYYICYAIASNHLKLYYPKIKNTLYVKAESVSHKPKKVQKNALYAET